MPFDAGGTFTRSYNWQADRDAGIKILAQRMDGEFNNYAGGLNQTFLRTGIVPMGGPLNMNSNPIVGISAGTLVNPGLRFENDTDTGIYSSGPGNISLVADGVRNVSVSAAGVAVTGTLSVTGPISINSGLTITGGNLVVPAGQALFSGGSSPLPGIAFAAEPSTGIWWTGGSVNVQFQGAQKINVTAANVAVVGPLSTTGGFVVGGGGASITGAVGIGGTLGVTGAITASAGIVLGDVNFSLSLSGPNPLIGFDAGGDYLAYIRSANYYQFTIAGQAPLSVTAAGISVTGTIGLGDAQHYMEYNGGYPAWHWDAGDFLQYSRTENILRTYIGNATIAYQSATQMTINTPLTVTYNIASTNGNIATTQSGLGNVRIEPAGSPNTGLISFLRTDGTRHGYIGYAPGPTGAIQYINDQAGGHNFVGGTLSQSGAIAAGGNISCVSLLTTAAIYPKSSDGNFVIYSNSGTPWFGMDANDYMYYDKAQDAFVFASASLPTFIAHYTGVYSKAISRDWELGFRDIPLRDITSGVGTISDADRGRGLVISGTCSSVNISDLGKGAVLTIVNSKGVPITLVQAGTVLWQDGNYAVAGNGNRSLGAGKAVLLFMGGTNVICTGVTVS